MSAQGELLPVEHRSLQPKRLKNYGHVNAEAIYAAEWRRFQKQFENQLLNTILTPDDAPLDPLGRVRPVCVSRRDAVVAASIIQWLGTNVGRGFASMCERHVEEATRLRLETGITRSNKRSRDKTDPRTPLERRKARLDAVRKRLAEAAR